MHAPYTPQTYNCLSKLEADEPILKTDVVLAVVELSNIIVRMTDEINVLQGSVACLISDINDIRSK